jgi:hypothetical protein
LIRAGRFKECRWDFFEVLMPPEMLDALFSCAQGCEDKMEQKLNTPETQNAPQPG